MTHTPVFAVTSIDRNDFRNVFDITPIGIGIALRHASAVSVGATSFILYANAEDAYAEAHKANRNSGRVLYFVTSHLVQS